MMCSLTDRQVAEYFHRSYKAVDGLWFMKNVNLRGNTKALVITADLDRKVINKMFALGASGYLIKPFDTQELLRHLAYHSK